MDDHFVFFNLSPKNHLTFSEELSSLKPRKRFLIFFTFGKKDEKKDFPPPSGGGGGGAYEQ